MCVCVRECVCMLEGERERVCVYVRGIEKERVSECVCESVCV